LRVSSSASFIVGSSWNKVLHDGVFVTDSSVLNGSADYGTAAISLMAKGTKDFELVLYTKTGMGDGQQANNPGYKTSILLQEFPGITM
jgi:molybdopterin-containing oxidoreductase family iron-sulfur binding subunit